MAKFVNMHSKEFERLPGESNVDYILRICSMKDSHGLSYTDIANIVSLYADKKYTNDGVRKLYNRYTYGSPSVSGKIFKEDFDKFKVSQDTIQYNDVRNQLNALYRRVSREESIKQIAHEYAEVMNQKLELSQGEAKKGLSYVREGILLLSDWHYGISFDNYWGKFNTEVVKRRLCDLFFEVESRIKQTGIKKLNVLNLGDLIAGRIHLKIRLSSRIDVITQIMDVSEILAQFLAKLSNIVEIVYYSCSDNHSRIEPNKHDSLDLESLTRITDWFLKERLPSLTIVENKFGDDIITLECLGHKVAAVHGHKDKQSSVVSSMTLMTKTNYDLICTAHEHHFSCDEKNETVIVSNPSLMGTDDYAKDLRLCASPAQTLIIVSQKNVIEAIHRIVLD